MGPTSHEDALDKCLILEAYEVQVGVKTLKNHTSSSGKRKHTTSDGVTDSRAPSLPDQILEPIMSAIKHLERTIIGSSKSSSPTNKDQNKNPPPPLKGETKKIHIAEKETKSSKKDDKPAR